MDLIAIGALRTFGCSSRVLRLQPKEGSGIKPDPSL
jgi:hypothetical protein